MWLLIHLLIEIQDVPTCIRAAAITAYTLSGGPWTIISDASGSPHNITLHFLERVRTDRTSADTYAVYIILISGRVFSLRLSRGILHEILTVDADRLERPSPLYAHTLHTVPETFPQSYFEQQPALDHCESRSFFGFPRRCCVVSVVPRWRISDFFEMKNVIR